MLIIINLNILTLAGIRWLQRPQLLLLQTRSVRVQLKAERLGGHILVLAVDQADRPPALLLVLRQDVAI